MLSSNVLRHTGGENMSSPFSRRGPSAGLARLFKPFFDPRDDAHMEAWCSSHEIDELGSLLEYNPRQSVQARVVLVMLTPSSSWLPFDWPYAYDNALAAQPLPMGRLPLPVLRLMLETISQLRRCRDMYRPAAIRSFREPDWGSDDFDIRRIEYRTRLLELMVRLPAGRDRDRAYSEYVRGNHDGSPYVFGGNFGRSADGMYLRLLLGNPGIDVRYKLAADTLMRDIVREDLKSGQRDEKGRRTLLAEYTSIVGDMISRPDGPAYRSTLVESQIRFLLDLGIPGAFHTFSPGRMMDTFTAIGDPELRQQLAKAYVLGGPECPGGEPCRRRPEPPARPAQERITGWDLGELSLSPVQRHAIGCSALCHPNGDGPISEDQVDAETWLQICRARDDCGWEPGHVDSPDPGIELVRLSRVADDGDTEYCGRLVADSDDGLNLAWELLEACGDDPGLKAVLTALIEEVQGSEPHEAVVMARRAAYRDATVTRLCEL